MQIVSEFLNNRLIKKQGLDEKTVRLIEEKHSELNQLITKVNSLKWNDENKQQIFQLTKSIENIEFVLQGLWGFEQNANYHTHWLRIGHCTCPRMDNIDIAYYGGGKIHLSDCLIHGEEANPEMWQNLKQARQH